MYNCIHKYMHTRTHIHICINIYRYTCIYALTTYKCTHAHSFSSCHKHVYLPCFGVSPSPPVIVTAIHMVWPFKIPSCKNIVVESHCASLHMHKLHV